MSEKRNAGSLAVCLLLLSMFSVAGAQETVYKWTDEDGVVHFGASAPPGVAAEVVTTSAAPTPAPTAAPVVEQAPAAPAAEPTPNNPPVNTPTPISEMSLQELDARCEAAREALIAPLREAEIERCQAQPRSDPAACVRMNADFGAPVRTVNGTVTPRMFHDIPPCADAHNERNRRGR